MDCRVCQNLGYDLPLAGRPQMQQADEDPRQCITDPLGVVPVNVRHAPLDGSLILCGARLREVYAEHESQKSLDHWIRFAVLTYLFTSPP